LDAATGRGFQLCFWSWVAALTNTPTNLIAIDGKTSRRSYQKKCSKEAIHFVSAYRTAALTAGMKVRVFAAHPRWVASTEAKVLCVPAFLIRQRLCIEFRVPPIVGSAKPLIARSAIVRPIIRGL
jgi:hypothetical protein